MASLILDEKTINRCGAATYKGIWSPIGTTINLQIAVEELHRLEETL